MGTSVNRKKEAIKERTREKEKETGDASQKVVKEKQNLKFNKSH